MHINELLSIRMVRCSTKSKLKIYSFFQCESHSFLTTTVLQFCVQIRLEVHGGERGQKK